MKDQIQELAPCGVFCGACPSFQKTCFGCSSASKEQRRTSWMSCKIRKCCFEQKRYQYCAECAEFPCETINKKLIESHPDNPKYTYRHEIPENVEKFNILGQDAYLIYQEQKWSCPVCGGRVTFYDYQCQECGKQTFE
jgi:hypothetical protein